MGLPRREEAGATLIEMLMAIVISSVVISAVATGMLTVARANSGPDSISATLTDSRDEQRLQSTLPMDAKSVLSTGVNRSPTGTGCAAWSGEAQYSAGPTPILTLTWSDLAGATQVSTYAVGKREGAWELLRMRCADAASPSVERVAGNLDPLAPATALAAPDVGLAIEHLTGYGYRVSTLSRVADCGAIKFVISPPALRRSSGGGPGSLEASLTVSVAQAGACSLSIRFVPNGSTPVTRTITSNLTFAATEYAWSVGTHPFDLVANGAVIGTTVFTVCGNGSATCR